MKHCIECGKEYKTDRTVCVCGGYLKHVSWFKKLNIATLVIFLFLFMPSQASAAIAFASAIQTSGVGTTITQSFTTSAGTNRILIALLDTRVADATTGVTYNGVAMTKISTSLSAGNGVLSMWYLIAPASGAHDLVITNSPSETVYFSVAEYTGAQQSGQPDATLRTAAGSGSPKTFNLTTVADNSWTVLGTQTGNDVGMQASTGSTARTSTFTNVAMLFDSNAAITPAGSTNMTVTQDAPGTDSWYAFMISIAPATAPAASPSVLKRLLSWF